jgi:MFS family permease
VTSTGESTGESAPELPDSPAGIAVPVPPSPLRVPAFRLLWLNNIAYFLVANAERFVFGWLVLDGLDLGEAQQGLVVFAFGVPNALLVLPAGAWADRWDRRRMLIATQVAGAVVMAATAVLVGSGHANFGLIVVAAVLSGSAAAMGSPVRASLIPSLVSKEQLFGAIALNAIAMTMSLIAGPVLAKLVGDAFGFQGAFWFQAVLMTIGITFLLRLRLAVVPPVDGAPERRSVVAEVRIGVRYVLDDRALRSLFGLLLLASLTVNPAVMVTIQAHVKDGLGRSAGEAALPFALMGAGIAITSVIILRRRDMTNRSVAFLRAMMAGSTITACIGLADSFAVVLVLAFAMGLAGGFFINMNQGLIQSNTPAEMMGRVMGLYTLVVAGIMPVGALLLGATATVIGTGPTITAAGVVSLVIVALTAWRNTELRRLG